MNQKDKFLQDVTKDIKYIFARKKIRKELENHILEGLDAGFSEVEVITDMGDPKKISEDFNKIYSNLDYVYLLLWITLISFMLFTSYHYIKARSHAREIQNTTIFNPYEMEQLDVKIYDHQSLDHTINLGHMSYQFTDIYLNDNQEVYLIYKFEKLDPYIYDSVQYSIDTCNDKQCFYDSRIHFDHYNKDIGFSKTAYLKFDASEIPTTLVLKYQHTLLDEVQKIFEIEIRENYE